MADCKKNMMWTSSLWITHMVIKFNLATYDMIFNSIIKTPILCRQRDGKPWKMQKWEDPLKVFVHNESHVNDIVEDMTASKSIVFYNIQLLLIFF